MAVEDYKKQYREQRWRKIREGLGGVAMVISTWFLGPAYNDYQSLIHLLRGETLFNPPSEMWVNMATETTNSLVTNLIIGFMLLALGIFLVMFKGTNRQLVGVLIASSSVLLVTFGIHGAFSVSSAPLVIISLILLAIGFFITYKGKSSSQMTTSSTTT